MLEDVPDVDVCIVLTLKTLYIYKYHINTLNFQVALVV